MTGPCRLQRRWSTPWQPWKTPEGARFCGRPTRFGNPFVFGTRAALARVPAADLVTPWEYETRQSQAGITHPMCWANGDITTHDIRYMTRQETVDTFRRALIAPTTSQRLGRRYDRDLLHLDVDTVRTELAGRDLVCWCPLDQPCHADVLLWVANAPETEIKEAAQFEYETIRSAALRVAELHPAHPERIF